MRPNIFDNMMAMMEKYANNLEQLVDERTDQLQEEKKKTEALLLEMLPVEKQRWPGKFPKKKILKLRTWIPFSF